MHMFKRCLTRICTVASNLYHHGFFKARYPRNKVKESIFFCGLEAIAVAPGSLTNDALVPGAVGRQRSLTRRGQRESGLAG